MLSTREVMDQFGMSKSKVESLIRRKSKAWNLQKGEGGFWFWGDEAIQKLKEYLGNRQAVIPAVISSQTEQTSAEQTAVMLASALGEKLKEHRAGIESLMAVMMDGFSEKEERYRQEIVSLRKRVEESEMLSRQLLAEAKRGQAETLSTFEHRFSILLDKKDRETTAVMVEKEKSIEALVSRIERRQEPESLLGKLWKRLNSPILSQDRRARVGS